MSRLNIEQAMGTAISHHQAGQLAEAEQLYRQVLAVHPNHADALHLLGVIAGQAGRHDIAAELIQKAIVSSPGNPAFYSNLGMSLLNLSQLEPAISAFERAIALQPDNPEIHCRLGMAFYSAGRLNAAISAYQQAIKLHPYYFEALHNLGNALVIARQYDQAIDICQRALVLNPSYPPTHNNLGNAYKGKESLDQAVASYQQALALNPNYAEAHNNLGNTLQDKKQFDQAIASYQAAIALIPDNAEFYCNLGTALMGKDQVDEAIDAYQKALALRPDDPRSLYNIAVAWTEKEEIKKAIGLHEKAIALQPDYFDALLNLGAVYASDKQFSKGLACLNRAVALKSDSPEVFNNFGVIFRETGELDQAEACIQKAIQLKPGYAEAYNNLGNVLKDKGNLDQAIRTYLHALTLHPDHFELLSSLGGAWKEGAQLDKAMECYHKALSVDVESPNGAAGLASTYQDMGQIDNAVKYYRQALKIDPKRLDTHEGLLFGLLYNANAQPLEILEAHVQWDLHFAAKFNPGTVSFNNDTNPDRRLRIGYVSGDFRQHSVNHFIQPLLEAHNKELVEVYCYANVKRTDAVTDQLKATVAAWRDILKLDDDEAADLIRQDQIDILVDLAGHTGYNRLLVFARKPAPVQVNYQGYAATTGLSAVDYRITDPYADPPGMTESHHAEKLMRLPTTAWCYKPPADAPEVEPTPALQSSRITLGSLNYLGKVSDLILTCWMQILAAVPDSRLLFKAKGITQTGSRQRVERLMEAYGIAPDRVELIDWLPSAQHYKHFGRIHIALDSFPYHGTTTTCETLWMGVPVVTLAGQTHVSRVGVSLMTNLGLPQLVGATPEEYVKIAVDLASNIPRLADLRTGMRQRMKDSPLMDSAGLARGMESLFRTMWHHWCQQQGRFRRSENVMTSTSDRLKELAIELPPVSGPYGAYVPVKRVGNLIYVAGQLPMKDGKLLAAGQVPSKTPVDTAKQAARQCVINALGAVHSTLGSVDSIVGVIRVGVFVSSDSTFTQQPQVANGASELLLDIFGEPGKHVRAAVGVNTLPLDASVEVEFIFEIASG